MAKKLFPFSNNKIEQQFNEILYQGITYENINEDELFRRKSPDGTIWAIKVNNLGNLYTEEV